MAPSFSRSSAQLICRIDQVAVVRQRDLARLTGALPSGCALNTWLSPVVEYRTCPMAILALVRSSMPSLKTSVTKAHVLFGI